MIRCMSQATRIIKEERCYLQMGMVVCFLIPIAYFAYLSMSAALLQKDWMSLLAQSSVEGLSLIVNVTMFYSAYAIRLYLREKETRNATRSFTLLMIAQMLFLNPCTFSLLFFYIAHFHGWKNWKDALFHAEKRGNWAILVPSVFVLLLAIVTLLFKLQLQLLG